MTMLKINWSQIKDLQTHLERQGFHPEKEILAIVMYKKSESSKSKIRFKQLREVLFALEAHPSVIGIFLFDNETQKPLWSTKLAEIKDSIEVIPSSGHPTIVLEFKNMSPTQRDVWLEMTIASIQDYIRE